MELGTEVMIHNEILGIKGSRGVLLDVGEEGYYEVNLKFGANMHRVLLPIEGTVLIAQEPEPVIEAGIEVERGEV